MWKCRGVEVPGGGSAGVVGCGGARWRGGGVRGREVVVGLAGKELEVVVLVLVMVMVVGVAVAVAVAVVVVVVMAVGMRGEIRYRYRCRRHRRRRRPVNPPSPQPSALRLPPHHSLNLENATAEGAVVMMLVK